MVNVTEPSEFNPEMNHDLTNQPNALEYSYNVLSQRFERNKIIVYLLDPGQMRYTFSR